MAWASRARLSLRSCRPWSLAKSRPSGATHGAALARMGLGDGRSHNDLLIDAHAMGDFFAAEGLNHSVPFQP